MSTTDRPDEDSMLVLIAVLAIAGLAVFSPGALESLLRQQSS